MSNKKNDSSFVNQRPTSPHLQIYRWNVSSLTSIIHRFTGISLFFAILLLSWYITYYTYQINVSGDSEGCDCPMQQLIDFSFFLAGVFITFALYYHFCNGIRHLFWDIGKGFEKQTAKTNSALVIVTSILLTAITISLVIYFKIS